MAVLSPHLDDAVLSCGAVLSGCAAAGVHAVTVTVFNGPPDGPLSAAARDFHAQCGHGDDAMAHREIEDDLATTHLGAASIRLGLPEALYRGGTSGRHRYPKGKDIFGSRPEAEAELVADIIERLTSTPAIREAELLLVPLGVGDHIDHQIVAAAARKLRRPLLWYEDVPYVLFDNCLGWEDELAPTDPMACRVIAEHWRAKLDAIDCYASQHSILWHDATRWRQDLTAYAISLGDGVPAERYWRRRP